MSKYICPTCNREFGKISHLKDHLTKKKKPCQQQTEKIAQNEQKIAQNNINLAINAENLVENDNKFKCSYCDITFTLKSSVSRHIKKFCKVKKNLDNEKEKIFKLLLEKDEIINNTKKENEELKELIKEQNIKIGKIIDKIGTKNINNGIINNNIIITSDKLLKFGSENLSKINNKLFNNVLKTTGKDCFIECAKNIYNNPDLPQNQNIYISDISRNKFLAYDGKNWKLENKIKVLTDISDKIKDYIDMNEEELKDKLKDVKFKEIFTNKLKKYYNLYYEEDEQATDERIKQFQNLVDENLIKFLYDIRNDVKKNYNKLIEENTKNAIDI
jgi:hypothetical protein